MKSAFKTLLGAVTGGTVLILSLSIAGVVDLSKAKRSVLSFWNGDPIGEFMADSAPAGSPIRYNLQGEPTTEYGQSPVQAYAQRYASLAQQHRLVYAGSLDHAAREVAAFYRSTRRLAPSGALAFILEAAGATYWGVRQTVLVTTETGLKPIDELLRGYPEAQREGWHIGVSDQVVDPSSRLRIIVVLTAQKTFTGQALPKRLRAGENKTFRGRLSDGYSNATALAMGPDGQIKVLKNEGNGREFAFNFLGKRGQWLVELVATGPVGPIPLTQVTVYVDTLPPATYTHHWPLDEDKLTNPLGYMTDLINRSRRKHGLPTLKRVSALDKVARRHSVDMQTHHYVGHYSERTGTVTQRLNGIAYPRYTYGENVALNGSILDAHEGLMTSLGHRRNLLSPDYSELGLGMVKGQNGWYITQVFSSPGPQTTDAQLATTTRKTN